MRFTLMSPALVNLEELKKFTDRQRNSFEGVAKPPGLQWIANSL